MAVQNPPMATLQETMESLTYGFLNLRTIFLPIKLSEFKAILTPQKTVQLTWKSELETNSRGFEIERGSDGTSFEENWIY